MHSAVRKTCLFVPLPIAIHRRAPNDANHYIPFLISIIILFTSILYLYVCMYAYKQVVSVIDNQNPKINFNTTKKQCVTEVWEGDCEWGGHVLP